MADFDTSQIATPARDSEAALLKSAWDRYLATLAEMQDRMSVS